MKRCWIGAAFLLALLIGSLAVSRAMKTIHTPVEENLNLAAESALAGDWESGRSHYLRARTDWERWDHFRSCFADHTPVEEISAGFQALEVYCAEQEEVDFAARCRELSRKTAAIGEAHGLAWWNVF